MKTLKLFAFFLLCLGFSMNAQQSEFIPNLSEVNNSTIWTAYNRKDIIFIDHVFSENALIIVGRVIKVDPDGEDDEIAYGFIGQSAPPLYDENGLQISYYASISHYFYLYAGGTYTGYYPWTYYPWTYNPWTYYSYYTTLGLDPFAGVDPNGYGGASLCENASSPTIINCVIMDCTVGGGVGADGETFWYDTGEDSDGLGGGFGGHGYGDGFGGALACLEKSSPIVDQQAQI